MTKLKESQIKRFNQAKKYLDDNNIRYELVSKTDSLEFFKIKAVDWFWGEYDEELSSYDVVSRINCFMTKIYRCSKCGQLYREQIKSHFNGEIFYGIKDHKECPGQMELF